MHWNEPGTEFVTAALAILVHVINYNLTARIEHHTRLFSRILGKHAVYYYAVYLVASALIRDHFIQIALEKDAGSFGSLGLNLYPISVLFFAFGVLLNLWTLKALGIKGMYNGDSFGYLMDAPVTDGPYQYLNEPQYVGTSFCLLGSALYYQTIHGIILTGILYGVFTASVELLEKPHMNELYSKKSKKD